MRLPLARYAMLYGNAIRQENRSRGHIHYLTAFTGVDRTGWLMLRAFRRGVPCRVCA
ncbi:protein of unknown function [Acidithiobacillus ferrivorans]|uniref:Transposase n=1 Tax=Acidithiobacillus ferrivorans TaxID=160808 RepID=A0ABY1MP86_9PROT|nr:protein of unknown function [Acidithiobacillus ferrivorans]